MWLMKFLSGDKLSWWFIFALHAPDRTAIGAYGWSGAEAWMQLTEDDHTLGYFIIWRRLLLPLSTLLTLIETAC